MSLLLRSAELTVENGYDWFATVDRYEATAEIVMGRGPKPAGDPNAFDAREVINNLGSRVTRPAS
ncbi:hypothetical protein LTR94_033752 [Friedmanniomyces endolithicus]|nr:hypothetical protein LTR94_033752 [Friedmanniomyces endolithicus]